MVVVLHASLNYSGVPRVLTIGRTGVDLFFVLSGFLITGILLREKGTPGFLRNFYARRSLRILPLYYTFLVFAAVLFPLFGYARPSWEYWVFLQNFGLGAGTLPQGPGYPSHFWSLAVEEHFYLFWPFLVLWLSRRRLKLALAGIIIGAFALRAALAHSGLDVSVLTPTRIDTLAGGALIAIFFAEGTLERYKPRLLAVLVFILPATLASFLWLSGSLAVQVAKPSLVGFVYIAALVAALGSGLLSRALEWAPLRSVGKYSYAMYVLHMVFVWAFAGLPPVVALPLILLCSYGSAVASWRFLESPFAGLKRRFEYGRPELASASADNQIRVAS